LCNHSGAAPVVDEVGPYKFQEKSQKYQIQFSDDGNLVTYTNLFQYDLHGDQEALNEQVRS